MSNSVKLIAVNDPNRKVGDVYEASKQVADLFVKNGIAKLAEKKQSDEAPVDNSAKKSK